MTKRVSGKRAPARSDQRGAGLRRDVLEAIDRSWPDGIVEMSFDPEESYFYELHPKLSGAFRGIRDSSLVHEHEADGGPVWWDESDPEEDPPDDTENSRSYHMFFVCPEGKSFTFETEAETLTEPDSITDDLEEDALEGDLTVSIVSGAGRTGWVVAVSLLAPFAVIELGDDIVYEDGGSTELEIESYAETADGKLINAEEHFRETHSTEAYKTIQSLRARIVDILEGFGITVLPPKEWKKPVPWLRGGEETCMEIESRPIRVLDAFFFESL